MPPGMRRRRRRTAVVVGGAAVAASHHGKKQAEEQAAQDNEASQPVADPTEELKKYKDLLDQGVLTQEEFDAKKKELLNL